MQGGGIASYGALAFLQMGGPSLGTMPSDLWRGTGATGCALCKDEPRPPCPSASCQVLASAPAQSL